MRRTGEALLCLFYLLFGGSFIVGGWGLVEWDRKFDLHFRSWCYSSKWGGGVSPAPSLVFTLSGTFHNIKNYRRNPWSQCQRGYWGHGFLWHHTRHVTNPIHPLKATGYIYHTSHSTKSPFLYTTQLQVKLPPREESKIITPRSTNSTPVTSKPTLATPSTVTLKHKGPLQMTKSSI